MKLFDMHCDTLFKIYEEGGSLHKNEGHISLEKTHKFEAYAQFFALFCGDNPLSEAEADIMLDALLHVAQVQFAENSSQLKLCKDKNDMAIAASENKTAAFLSIEGAELLQSDEALKKAHDAGVRMISLTWNHANPYGFGALKDNDKGLTDRGKTFVQKLDENGIIVDVSHLSEHGFWDLAELTKKPFVASHSNAKAVCNHLRNLSDEQFTEIKKRGGIVGINLYNSFLVCNKKSTIDDVICHIEHFLSLGGEKFIGLGADFDGCDNLPTCINDVRDMEKIYEALLKRNYSQNLIDDIFYNNMFDFIKRMV